MKGWYIRDNGDYKEFICKNCGHVHDVPYETCPDCGNYSGGNDNENDKA